MIRSRYPESNVSPNKEAAFGRITLFKKIGSKCPHLSSSLSSLALNPIETAYQKFMDNP